VVVFAGVRPDDSHVRARRTAEAGRVARPDGSAGTRSALAATSGCARCTGGPRNAGVGRDAARSTRIARSVRRPTTAVVRRSEDAFAQHAAEAGDAVAALRAEVHALLRSRRRV